MDIEETMKLYGVRQYQVADLLGINRGNFSMMLKGKYPCQKTTREVLAKVEGYLAALKQRTEVIRFTLNPDKDYNVLDLTDESGRVVMRLTLKGSDLLALRKIRKEEEKYIELED